VIVMGRRPTTVVEEVKIDLPRPHDIAVVESPPFNSYVRQLRKAIEASHAQ
jgi:NitT/TauT family transport system ATP-binding protein